MTGNASREAWSEGVMSDFNALIGNNLRIERERIGKSSTSLANALGIKRPVLISYENGELEFGEDFLNQAASVLGCKIGVFFQRHAPLPNVRFRSKKSLGSREAVLNCCSDRLQDLLFLEDLLDKKIAPRFQELRNICCTCNVNESAKKARQFLKLSDNEPVMDVCAVVERLGIRFVPFDYDDDNVSGLSANAPDIGAVLFVNNTPKLSVEHKRFSIIHEMAHLLRHSEDYRSDEPRDEDKLDSEADQFAGQFLMPDEAFEFVWKETNGLSLWPRVSRVKSYFGVSCQTVLYRLAKCFGQSVYPKFYSSYTRFTGEKFVRNVEPLPMPNEDFGMQTFNQLVREAIEREEITVSRGAEILGCSISNMQTLMDEWV